MKSKITRREILQLAGGSALGLILSPLPWKLLDDSAEWTQNWPWVPVPQRGEISYKFTTCSLCPSSCGLKLRCVGQQPVSIGGINQHPLSNGAICSIGILAHHLRYHPARVKTPIKFLRNSKESLSCSFDDVMNEMNAASSSGTMVILDGSPERTASSLYRQISETKSSIKYIPVHTSGIDALSGMSGKSVDAGFDIDNAKTILSFGSPLFDGWGSPSRAAKFLNQSRNIIQIESNHSRSAQFASTWIPIRPGTEILLALGMAQIIIKENLYDKKAVSGIKDFQEFTAFIESFAPDAVAEIIGIKSSIIQETVRTFINNAPSVAITGSDSHYQSIETQTAVMALNILAGNIGKTGGITIRQAIPRSIENKNSYESMVHLPDHSVRVLILDESLSGLPLSNKILQNKLADDGIIISFSPFATARPFAVQYVIPSSVVFETLTDVAWPSDRAGSSLSLSASILPAKEGAIDAIQFAQQLAKTLGIVIENDATEALLKKRVSTLYQSKRGSVFNASTGQTAEVTSLSTSDDIWKALIAGGCWMDSASSAASFPDISLMPQLLHVTLDSFKELSDGNHLLLHLSSDKTVYHGKDISPLMSKVRRESNLRSVPHQASINPETADAFHLLDGDDVSLQTNNGTLYAKILLDASVMPGIVSVFSFEESTVKESKTVSSDMIDKENNFSSTVNIRKI